MFPSIKEANMDEQVAHDLIEAQAEEFLGRGYEPSDAEPGEWLEMINAETGHVVYITPEGTEETAS